MVNKQEWKCPFERVRDYPGCFEDCPDTEVCQMGKQTRLDRPELREKAPILKSYIVPDRTPWFDGHVEFPTLEQQRDADHEHYKALIPDVEEQFAKGIEHYRKVILPVMVEEAKKQERERIIDKVENLIIGGRLGKPEQEGEDVYFLEAKGWQALRGEK